MVAGTVAIIDEWPDDVQIKVYRGDIFGESWEMDLEDYSTWDPPGPANLDEPGITITGYVRYSADDVGEEPVAEFDVQIINAAARTIKPLLWPEETANIEENGYYDLQITQDRGADPPFVDTFLQGRLVLGKDKTN